MSATKKIVKKKVEPETGVVVVWRRPCAIKMEILFEEGNRKVTPADLELAAQAAAASARSVLESRYKPYSIAEIDVTVDYTYVHSRAEFSA